MALEIVPKIVVGPQTLGDGVEARARAGRDGSQLVSQGLPDYYEMVRNGQVYMAHAIVTAPVIYSTAAGTGGPILHNRSSDKVGVILKVGIGSSVVTTVAGSIGFTGRSDQGDTVMGTTTAIDSQRRLDMAGVAAAGSITAYRIATPAAAGDFFLPIGAFHTGALTVDNFGMGWFDIGGLITIPPGAWVSLAGSATLSTLVMQAAIIYAEVPR